MAHKLLASILIIGVVTVVVSGGPGYMKRRTEEKCGTDEACLAAAERCRGEGGRKHHKDGGSETRPDKLTAFNQCLEENGQGSAIINEQDCVEGGPGGHRQRRSHHHKCMKEIIDTMNALEESVAGPIRCCFSQATGFDKVNSDGSMNVDLIRTDIQERVTDQAILDIYEEAFNTCLPRGEQCNAHSFFDCLFDECLAKAQALN